MGTCLYPGNTSVQDVDGTVKNENEKEIFNVFSKKIARDLTMKRIVACHNWGAACGMMRGEGGGGWFSTKSWLALPVITRADHNMHQSPEGKHLQFARAKKRAGKPFQTDFQLNSNKKQIGLSFC